ncbi:MAG: hypothetical protein BWY67_01768 [Bacteroidetes bacterium ADurb.Bin397]|nr:MAG: hypothetical protein BWY67_01768 [Bacteroidetes bacterium ADurb.Bin397]
MIDIIIVNKNRITSENIISLVGVFKNGIGSIYHNIKIINGAIGAIGYNLCHRQTERRILIVTISRIQEADLGKYFEIK